MFFGYFLIGLVEVCIFILAIWGCYSCIMLIITGIKFTYHKTKDVINFIKNKKQVQDQCQRLARVPSKHEGRVRISYLAPGIKIRAMRQSRCTGEQEVYPANFYFKQRHVNCNYSWGTECWRFESSFPHQWGNSSTGQSVSIEFCVLFL